MLERLSLRDLALIDRAEIEFGPGLNVITGETGSGKSLLVQAVDLLIGERADAEFVRDGARSATVQGEFRVAPNVARAVTQLLETWGIEFDGETVIVRREIAAGGKSRAIVNQSAVTLSALKQLGELLADLHGQHEHQSLLRADAGLETLDRLASLHDVRARYVAALAAHRTAAAELERLEASLRTYHDERDEMEETARDIDWRSSPRARMSACATKPPGSRMPIACANAPRSRWRSSPRMTPPPRTRSTPQPTPSNRRRRSTRGSRASSCRSTRRASRPARRRVH